MLVRSRWSTGDDLIGVSSPSQVAAIPAKDMPHVRGCGRKREYEETLIPQRQRQYNTVFHSCQTVSKWLICKP